MDREAAATAICAVVIMAAFWAALLLLKDSPETLFEMPLWFSVSCLGGYVLSVVAVIFLVKRYFRDFDLDQDAPEESETTKGGIPRAAPRRGVYREPVAPEVRRL